MKKKDILGLDLDLAAVQGRWKKESESSVSQALDESSIKSPFKQNLNGSSVQQAQRLEPCQQYIRQTQTLRERPRNHYPQIIDEDTQHFKIRLQHLLGVFKSDAITQFLNMKRSMLDDQKQQVRQDTSKYLALYQEKHNQNTSLKQNLARMTAQNNHLSQLVENLSTHLLKQRNRGRKKYTEMMCFGGWKQFLIYAKKQKMSNLLSDQFFLKRGGRRIFQGFANIIKQRRSKALEESRQQAEKKYVEEACLRYEKEIAMLKQRLADSYKKIDEANAVKLNLQDNLKKAFMRGVSVLNFQAMNALQGHGVQLSEMFTQPHKQNKQINSSQSHNSSVITVQAQPTLRQETKKSVVCYQTATESKQHRWRESQVLGQSSRGEEWVSELPESHYKQRGQGKVIKVSKGKSFVESRKQN